MRVLVYGATGSQAHPVAEQLLERGHEVNIVVRHVERAADLETKGARVFRGDLNDSESLSAAHDGVEGVFLMLPFGAQGDPLALAGNALKVAEAARVKLLVLNTSGQTPKTPTGLPMMDYRIALEAAVRASGIPSITLRPSVYMENLLGPWTLPGVQQRREVAYPVAAHRPVSWLASQDLGRFAVAAFERPALAGQAFDLGGPEALTGDGIARGFTRALGTPVSYRAISPDEFGDLMAQIMGPEAGEGIKIAYRAGEAAPLDAMRVDLSGVLEQLPVQLTTLETWVSQHAALFAAVVQDNQVRGNQTLERTP